jgi:hypothetical protein
MMLTYLSDESLELENVSFFFEINRKSLIPNICFMLLDNLSRCFLYNYLTFSFKRFGR